jgi:hypothetical protein
MLINFTAVSADIGRDMAIFMHNSDHMRKFRTVPYRIIKMFNFESYIYKNCFSEMSVHMGSAYLDRLIANKDFHEYIPGILAVGDLDIIYNPEDGKCYTCYLDYYEYKDKILAKSLERLYPKIKLRENHKKYIKIYSEEFFDQYPGLADWAESVEYISQKLWIPENLIE